MRRLATGAAALALLAAGCGSDDEGRVEVDTSGSGTSTSQGTSTAPATQTSPSTAPQTTTQPETQTETGATTSPEDAQGGAGDEVAASSQALVTGNGGELTPRVVRVPPFIGIRLVLRSADGGEYDLRGGGKSVSAGGEIESASATFAGLRPGKAIVLSGSPGGSVRIEASAEPGP